MCNLCEIKISLIFCRFCADIKIQHHDSHIRIYEIVTDRTADYPTPLKLMDGFLFFHLWS